MRNEQKVDRRSFIGAATGAAGATALGAWPQAGPADNRYDDGLQSGRFVPRNRLSIQAVAIRDGIIRLNGSVSGYLGGPDVSEDPTDLGPVTPLAGGFAAVFDYLASVGYRAMEFWGFGQGANDPTNPTAAQIRAWLDAAGLRASGAQAGSLEQLVDPAYRRAQIEHAHVLGHRMIGTAFGGPLPTLQASQRYAGQANMVGAALEAEGIKYFVHPELGWFRFFDDPAHPELGTVHLIDWFMANTDPRYVFFEPDTMHTLAGHARFPARDGTLFDVDGWYSRLVGQRRLIAWHLKDADRIPLPAAGANLYAQLRWRPGFPLSLGGGVDAVYVGAGDIGRGYPDDVDPEAIGFVEMLQRYRLSDPGWFVNDSDDAPNIPDRGWPSDPGRSLRWAKVSAENILSLRARSRGWRRCRW